MSNRSLIGLAIGALVIAVCAFWLARPVQSDLLTPDERAYLQEHGPIRLAPDPFFPPVEYFNSKGEYEGYVADLFKVISKNLKVDIHFVRCRTWDEVLASAKAGKVDGITAAQMTVERNEFLIYSRPLADIPNVIIGRQGSREVEGFAQMSGLKVAITKGYALEEYIRTKYPSITLVPAQDDLQALQMVSFREVDAAVVNQAIASYLIQKYGLTNLRVAGDSGKRNELMIAIVNEEPVLCRILDKGLASVTDREKAAIYRKWVPLEAGTNKGLREFGSALGAGACLLFFGVVVVFIWNRSLLRQVRNRTRTIGDQNRQLVAKNVELENQGARLRATEEELRSVNAELEQRVLDRTTQLETTNRELEAFVYSVSHDLRGPLRAIGGYSQIIVEDYGDKLDSEGTGHLQRIVANTARMSRLIDDLLKLSRITRTELRVGPTSLSAIAKEIAQDLAASDPERDVTFKIDNAKSVTADASLVKVALSNLLENAWKFTANTPGARIEFGETELDGRRAFYVRDNGAGYDPILAERLFVPFGRLHDEKEYQGTGIGLAIVQRIISRHGGRIVAEGNPGQGACFTFTLQNSGVEIADR